MAAESPRSMKWASVDGTWRRCEAPEADVLLMSVNEAGDPEMHEAGVQLLQGSSDPETRLGLTCAIGDMRSGKSSLLNFLHTGSMSGPFTVGHSAESCTKGCRVCKPKTEGSRATALLDLEGWGNNGDDHDWTLVVPLLPLCSNIILNCTSVGRDHILKQVSYLLESTAEVAHLTGFGGQLGHLHIVLRDYRFSGAGATGSDRSLSDRVLNLEAAQSPSAKQRNQIRLHASQVFSSVRLWTLPDLREASLDKGPWVSFRTTIGACAQADSDGDGLWDSISASQVGGLMQAFAQAVRTWRRSGQHCSKSLGEVLKEAAAQARLEHACIELEQKLVELTCLAQEYPAHVLLRRAAVAEPGRQSITKALQGSTTCPFMDTFEGIHALLVMATPTQGVCDRVTHLHKMVTGSPAGCQRMRSAASEYAWALISQAVREQTAHYSEVAKAEVQHKASAAVSKAQQRLKRLTRDIQQLRFATHPGAAGDPNPWCTGGGHELPIRSKCVAPAWVKQSLGRRLSSLGVHTVSVDGQSIPSVEVPTWAQHASLEQPFLRAVWQASEAAVRTALSQAASAVSRDHTRCMEALESAETRAAEAAKAIKQAEADARRRKELAEIRERNKREQEEQERLKAAQERRHQEEVRQLRNRRRERGGVVHLGLPMAVGMGGHPLVLHGAGMGGHAVVVPMGHPMMGGMGGFPSMGPFFYFE